MLSLQTAFDNHVDGVVTLVRHARYAPPVDKPMVATGVTRVIGNKATVYTTSKSLASVWSWGDGITWEYVRFEGPAPSGNYRGFGTALATQFTAVGLTNPGELNADDMGWASVVVWGDNTLFYRCTFIGAVGIVFALHREGRNATGNRVEQCRFLHFTFGFLWHNQNGFRAVRNKYHTPIQTATWAQPIEVSAVNGAIGHGWYGNDSPLTGAAKLSYNFASIDEEFNFGTTGAVPPSYFTPIKARDTVGFTVIGYFANILTFYDLQGVITGRIVKSETIGSNVNHGWEVGRVADNVPLGGGECEDIRLEDCRFTLTGTSATTGGVNKGKMRYESPYTELARVAFVDDSPGTNFAEDINYGPPQGKPDCTPIVVDAGDPVLAG